MLRSAYAIGLLLLAAPALAQDGAALYGQFCGQCHDGGLVRAPGRRALAEMTPERIVASLESGAMRVQGGERTADERRAIAVFLSGKPLGSMTPPVTAPPCTRPAPPFTAGPASAWSGWSAAPTNDR